MASSLTPTVRRSKQQNHCLPYPLLKWRQGKLLVEISHEMKQPFLPAIENEKWLVACLKNSPVQLIRLAPELGEANLKFWADACEEAKKQVFIRTPSANKQLCIAQRKKSPQLTSWWLNRAINSILAAILLILLAPVMLVLVMLIHLYSPGTILSKQWHVGERGKLFHVFSFRTTPIKDENLNYEVIVSHNVQTYENFTYFTSLAAWMRKYKLDKLPQLFNVLRGEMRIIGPRPLSLSEAVRVTPEWQWRLNAQPGILGASTADTKFKKANSKAITTL